MENLILLRPRKESGTRGTPSAPWTIGWESPAPRCRSYEPSSTPTTRTRGPVRRESK